MKKFLWIFCAFFIMFQAVAGESLLECINIAERWIDRNYPAGSMANRVGKTKLLQICSSGSESEQIQAIKREFPQAFSGESPASASTLSTASTFTASLPGHVSLELVRIPKGEFMMGSPSTEALRGNDEIQHRVTLTKDFFLGKYEVTQAQWQAVMSNNPSRFKGPRRPVEQVSWNAAMQFCETLTAIGHRDGWLPENWMFTLPTEAQWEYACRAGTDTPFSYGSSSDVSKMNFKGNYPYGGANKGVYRQSTVEVGSLGYRNNFGLYDMHGNVLEWCLDYYGSYSRGAVSDPFCATGSLRVIRGGSWGYYAEGCRSAARRCDYPLAGRNFVGFRLALVEVQ